MDEKLLVRLGCKDEPDSSMEYKKLDKGLLDTESFSCYDSTNDTLYISIRGSDAIWKGLMDWVTNILIVPFPSWSHKKFVSLGIFLKELTLRKQIDELIEEHEVSRIVFTGHSNGAGVAHLLYDYYRKNFAIEAECLVYACPRVFWFYPLKTGARGYKYGWDIVPNLPPSFLLFSRGYEIEKIGKGKNIFFDHFPKNYVNWIEKNK